MSWYKKAQVSELNWDRFKKFIDVWTWDEVVETGEASKEEQDAIISLDYYPLPVTEKTIEGLKKGQRYQFEKPYTIIADCVDGKDMIGFDSLADAREYCAERIQHYHTPTHFGSDYCNYYLEGFSLDEIGISRVYAEQNGMMKKEAWGEKTVQDSQELETEELVDAWESSEDDIKVNDKGEAYCSGRLIAEPDENYNPNFVAIRDWMNKNKYWPNVWVGNDHGNVSLYSIDNAGNGHYHGGLV